MKRLAIIGSGMTGMSLAYFLKDDFEVHLWGADVAGLSGWFQLAGGQYLEKFYHHFFLSDDYMLAMVEELGLKDVATSSTARTVQPKMSGGPVRMRTGPLRSRRGGTART